MKKSTDVYIGLGSNLGDREKNLLEACKQIAEIKDTELVEHSSLYESPAYGFEGKDFINMAILIRTQLTPTELHQCTLDIESKMGKIRRLSRNDSYMDRCIDIDLLSYGNRVLKTASLELPHPEMNNRLFVMKPLLEVKKLVYSCSDDDKETLFFLEEKQKVFRLTRESSIFSRDFAGLSTKFDT